ncbi:MAG: hypothetical protein QNJ05_12385 [Woeseiaceae bacterium]|nr:hypothetical protein [Woeseiaceae bacterium]
MATSRQQHAALPLIFAFFLGLMVTAFIGVGVYTFFPDELQAYDKEIRLLWDNQQMILEGRGAEGLTEDEEALVASLKEQLRETEAEKEQIRQAWARTTSIILVVLATLVMGTSFIFADRIRVIGNGLLLGGVFTMLYGTGWILASGASQARFWVMAFALIVTLSLGYARFGRKRAEKQAPGGSTTVAGELAERVNELERRLKAASDAMGQS